jgi:hypothetical protein
MDSVFSDPEKLREWAHMRQQEAGLAADFQQRARLLRIADALFALADMSGSPEHCITVEFNFGETGGISSPESRH